MQIHTVALPPPKSTRVLAGVTFRLCKIDEASRKGADLATTHDLASVARGDGPEICWAFPRKPTKSARCWLCWTHDSRDWYQAYVDGPAFLKTWRAIVDEVVR